MELSLLYKTPYTQIILLFHILSHDSTFILSRHVQKYSLTFEEENSLKTQHK